MKYSLEVREGRIQIGKKRNQKRNNKEKKKESKPD
jgi:hypothetical protein